jgi:hypothetical protein|tara:strand:+ start:573 stop:779 length:207 start_codon:yes stop_codon:yes gene_type:complete
LEYSGDVDLEKKLKTLENFYNSDRPHRVFAGKIPYEALKEKLKLKLQSLWTLCQNSADIFHKSIGLKL